VSIKSKFHSIRLATHLTISKGTRPDLSSALKLQLLNIQYTNLYQHLLDRFGITLFVWYPLTCPVFQINVTSAFTFGLFISLDTSIKYEAMTLMSLASDSGCVLKLGTRMSLLNVEGSSVALWYDPGSTSVALRSRISILNTSQTSWWGYIWCREYKHCQRGSMSISVTFTCLTNAVLSQYPYFWPSARLQATTIGGYRRSPSSTSGFLIMGARRPCMEKTKDKNDMMHSIQYLVSASGRTSSGSQDILWLSAEIHMYISFVSKEMYRIPGIQWSNAQ
jgi:hypothetical protein